ARTTRARARGGRRRLRGRAGVGRRGRRRANGGRGAARSPAARRRRGPRVWRARRIRTLPGRRPGRGRDPASGPRCPDARAGLGSYVVVSQTDRPGVYAPGVQAEILPPRLDRLTHPGVTTEAWSWS